MFDTSEIMPEQYLNNKGNPLVKQCLIKNQNEYYKVAHSFNEIEKLISPFIVKGYRNV